MIDQGSRQIEIKHIEVKDRLRKVGSAWVEALAVSIENKGLLQAIVVFVDGDRYRLAAGAHRLAAAKQLNWQMIEARVYEPEPDAENPFLEARLLEIDENLFRRELRGLDRMRSLSERKDLYLEVYPETKRGGDKGNQHTGGKNRLSEIFSFSQDTAEKIGLGRRTVEMDIATYKALSDESIAQLTGTSFADKAAYLRSIAALKHDDQRKVLDLAIPVGGMELVAAINYVTGKKTITGTDKIYHSAVGNLNRLTLKRREDVFEAYQGEIVAFVKRRGLL